MADKAKKPKAASNQDRFAVEYVKDLNGTQAAIRAGYSEKSAAQQASRLLTNAKVLSRIAELQAERAAEHSVTGQWVVDQLKTAAEKNLSAEPTQGAGIKALELLGKHLGIFGEDNRQKAGTTTEDIIRALDERDERTKAEVRKQHGNGVTDIRKAG